ncbi:MAG: TonB-dependent receptor [Candidatus Latescibacteria bacterium]|jgi:iron complex outermembrane recepter protein|nr:TonB-dependent receptor [Candidatus Latescibacterota bacterium]
MNSILLKRCMMIILLLLTLYSFPVYSQEPELTEEVYFRPIETVITAGRTEQSIERAPATVTVISSEEIQASGALTIPELLRFVPGIDVMSISSSHSELNARGLNQLLSKKMLVLIDGRSVYFDFFGGVIWQGLPILLNQIDRIEIVRSPGSALYGANAFSGVINIITKTPRQLRGGHLQIQGGENGTLYTSAIQGGWEGDTEYRFALGTRKINSFKDPEVSSEDVALGNFYLEHRFKNETRLSAEAGLSRGHIIQIVRIEDTKFEATTTFAKVNLDHGTFKLQAFWNRGDQTGGAFFPPGDDVDILYNTFDLDAQHILELGKRNTFIYGGTYRFNTIDSNIIDKDHEQNLAAVYIQDEFRPLHEVSLLAGARVDRHPLVGVNISPRGSVIYSPTDHHTLRFSVGKAFRNPSFTDSYFQLTTPLDPLVVGVPGLELKLVGEPDLESEKITTYEIGYMFFPSYRFRTEVNFFRYNFKDYIGFSEKKQEGTTFIQSYVNLGKASADGFEVSADIIPLRWLKMSSNYSYQNLNNDYTVLKTQYPPKHKANLKLFFNLPRGLSVSFLTSYIDKINWEIPTPLGDYAETITDAHTRCDGKIGYLLEKKRIEFFISVYNLFDSKDKEYPFAEEIRRRVIGGFNYSF